ncbi:IQ motif-containing protein H [Pleuronectes platessa]|uniref:IQ motif-containing protein H n=1 Tax=Pleuronectes platessa TaxID=8262 RepID=UPI00232A655C|nr:IQ motif-containing protein H [Pleuronectes platessa]
MSHRNQDKFGAVLLQVRDDLRQLRGNLEKIRLSDRTTLDIQALDDAIRKTENSIKKHAEDYLKTVSEQLLVLPNIEDIHKKAEQIPKWKPDLDSFPAMPPQREVLPGASQREKHKSTLSMHSLCNPAHSNNRAIMYQKSGTSLPDVHKRSTHVAKHPRMITGPAGRLKPWPRGNHNVAVLEDATGTLPDTSSLYMSIQHKAASLHPRQEPCSCKIDLIGSKSRCQKKLKWEQTPGSTCGETDSKCMTFCTTRTPPPSTSSQSMEHRSMMQAANHLISRNHQNLPVPFPVNISNYPFAITKGRMDPLAADFCLFKQSFSSCWSRVVHALEALEKLLRVYAVPMAKVSGERLVEFSHGWDSGWRTARPVIGLVSVLENWEEVLGLVSRPGQRFKGEGGIEAAAIHIQSCWRRCVARTAYLRHCRRKWAAGTISMSWLMRSQMRGVRKALQARRLRQLESYRSRAQNLAADWKHIQSSKRTIIHIPSLGYSQSQRLNLREFDTLQNIQINRLCEIRDKNVEVIYVCPRHLGEDILHYYTSLLVRDGATDGAENRTTEASSSVRPFIILTPEAVDYFPTRNMCLSTLLKYSPRTLKRIRHLIQGKQAYIVGGVAHVDDLAVADELGVPILGPEPAIAQLYSTKSGRRRIFKGAEVDVPPGQGDIYTLNKLHEALAEIMTQNLGVQRWLFKVDSEHSGRGTAYCDVCHLSCSSWALQEHRRHSVELRNTKWIQESVLLRYSDEIPEWLTRYARPAKASRYPNWACFLKTFLRQGGVVEAYPPSDSVTCLTVDLLLEPGGEVTVLSCGDQLHGSCQLEAVGCTVPQTSVHPETLHSICTRVGRACLQRCIVGHVSVDLATFLNHDTMEQEVWAIDLDLTYSDQLAMTQMLLMRTGGTLNCHTCCLEVPVREKYCEDQPAATSPVVNRYAVLGSHLFHSNLSMLYHNVFLMMCRAHGIRFNMKRKEGTVFALYDSSERCRIGMITVSEDLQGALVTFARNLSVIHQEISSSKKQEETNFKELTKNIEDVLQTIVQNKLRAVKDKPAA